MAENKILITPSAALNALVTRWEKSAGGKAVGAVAGGVKGGAGGFIGGLGSIGKMIPMLGIVVGFLGALVASSKSLQRVIGSLFKVIGMILQPIGDLLAIALRPLIAILRPFAAIMRAMFKPIRAQFNATIRQGEQQIRQGDMSGGLATFGKAFAMLFAPIADAIGGVIIEGLHVVVGGLTMGILETLRGFGNTILEAFSTMFALLRDSGIPLLNSIGEAGYNAFQGVKTEFNRGITELEKDSITSINSTFKSINSSLELNIVPLDDSGTRFGLAIKKFVDSADAGVTGMEKAANKMSSQMVWLRTASPEEFGSLPWSSPKPKQKGTLENYLTPG